MRALLVLPLALTALVVAPAQAAKAPALEGSFSWVKRAGAGGQTAELAIHDDPREATYRFQYTAPDEVCILTSFDGASPALAKPFKGALRVGRTYRVSGTTTSSDQTYDVAIRYAVTLKVLSAKRVKATARWTKTGKSKNPAQYADQNCSRTLNATLTPLR